MEERPCPKYFPMTMECGNVICVFLRIISIEIISFLARNRIIIIKLAPRIFNLKLILDSMITTRRMHCKSLKNEIFDLFLFPRKTSALQKRKKKKNKSLTVCLFCPLLPHHSTFLLHKFFGCPNRNTVAGLTLFMPF